MLKFVFYSKWIVPRSGVDSTPRKVACYQSPAWKPDRHIDMSRFQSFQSTSAHHIVHVLQQFCRVQYVNMTISNPVDRHGHGPALLDSGIELLPAACTPDSPRPWSSRAEPCPVEDGEPVSTQRKRRIFLACACILVSMGQFNLLCWGNFQ